MKNKIHITVLGSGTSSGIPTIGCKCSVCTSEDPKDKRLRSSILVQSGDTNIVVDTTPDFRRQMLRHKVDNLDAVLFTHHHFDHIGGFDDLRAFNFVQRKAMPIYLRERTYRELKRTFIYAFEKPEQIGGGVPLIDVNLIDKEPFRIGEILVQPFPILHGKMITQAFRFGRFAYCTDTNNIPEESMPFLENLEVLIIDALRFTPHSTHFSLSQAAELVSKVKPDQAYFIHMAHEVMHNEVNQRLPEGMQLSYDGLKFEASSE